MKRAEAYSSMHQLIDGKYRPAPGNWIKYEDHLVVVADLESLLDASQKVGAIALKGAGTHAERVETLKQAAIEACQYMGCYCEGEDGAEPDMEDDDREKCVMCKLSDVVQFDSADSGEVDEPKR